MNKLYTKQTWHNDTTPAINEDNLNHMEDGIDAIDSRLVEISGTLMETIPEILEMYDDIETLTKNPPYIGTNGNWYVWDTETGAYVDSGVDASITVTIADVTMLPTGSQPYVTNTGTNTDPIFHLFIPYGGSIIGVTGVKGDAESTYRSGDVNLTKANIGLGNVDNTSDANKPVSTATQTALNGKFDKTGGTIAGNVKIEGNSSYGTNVLEFADASITETLDDGNGELDIVGDDGVVINGVRIDGANGTPGAVSGNVDNTPTNNSSKLVKSGGVYSALSGKLDKSGGTITGDIVLGNNEGGGGSIEEEQGADWYIGTQQNPIHSGSFGDLNVTYDLDVGSDLDVGDDATVGGDLAVAGAATVTGNITARDIITEDGLEIVDQQGNLRFELDSDAEIDGTNVDTAPTSGSKHIVTSGGVYSALAAKQNTLTAGTGITIENDVISAAGSGVSSFNGRSGAVTPQSGDYTAAMVGLGNVVNTSDSATPVSGGTTKFTTGGAYTELAKKVDTTRKVNGHALSADVTVTASDVGAIPTTQKGTNSGVAELDSNGKVPSSQLPSYVDDVLEYSSQSAFPSTGESGKIYVATDTNKTYRWSGTAYVEISPSLALGETSSTAYRGDRGKTAYDHASETKASQTASGLYKVASTAQGHISSLTAVQKSDITALGIPGQDTTYTGTGLISINSSNVISTTAEVNQNAFSNVKVGSTTFAADSKTDTLELVAGSNVTLTPDATNDKVLIAATDTKYSTMSSSELTTGTATTARSVRADYLKTGVDSLIDTKINALDGGTIGTPSASKTLTALSETNGQVSATFGNIAITESQVTNLIADLAAKLPLSGGRIDGDITLGGTSDNPASIFAAHSDSQIGDTTHPIGAGYFDRIITTDTITADGTISTTMGLNVGYDATIDGNLEVSGNLSVGNIDNSDHSVTIAGVTIEKDTSDNKTAVTADNLIGDLTGNVTGNASSADKIGTATVGSATQPVYINGGVPTAAGNLMTQTSTTVASSGWTAESYTSPTGTVYGYKKDVTISGMTASSYIDGDISSGTYTGAYAFESASGKATIRTATQPSSSLTFRIYYQI